MKQHTLLLAFSITTPALAAVYKTVRPDGSVVYSDQPPRDEAAPHPLPPLQIIPSKNLTPTTPPQDRGINNAPPAGRGRGRAGARPGAGGAGRGPAGQGV